MVGMKKRRSPAEAQADLLKSGKKPRKVRARQFAPVDPATDAASRPSIEEIRAEVASILKQKVRAPDPHQVDTDTRRRALRQFMDQHKISASGWCKEAGVAANVLLNFLNGYSQRVTADTYEMLARVANVPVSRINGDEMFAEAPGTIPVIGFIAAGDFQETFPDYDDASLYSVTAPLPESVSVSPTRSHCFGLEVRGESMNRYYKEGSVVICLPVWAVKRDLRSGDHVIVERLDRDGSVEATVKEFVADDEGQGWLWPRSDNPKHQTPIELGADTTDEVKVSAYVVGSFNAAPNF